MASLVLNVFAPRNGGEFARVLRPDGALIVVTPTSDHLGELVAGCGLLAVDDRKDARLERSLAEHFTLIGRRAVTTPLRLAPDDIRRLVRMGPSAWHVTEAELEGRLPAPAAVSATAAVTISTYHPS